MCLRFCIFSYICSEADAPLDVYAKNVRLEEALIQAPSWISGNTLALPSCAADGRLIRDGILLLERSSPVGGGTTYTCSCATAANNIDRQDESASEVISASEDSGKESAAVTCVHIRVAEKLIPSSGDNAPGKAPLESSSCEPAIDIAIVRLKPLFAWVKEVSETLLHFNMYSILFAGVGIQPVSNVPC